MIFEEGEWADKTERSMEVFAIVKRSNIIEDGGGGWAA